MVSSNQRGLSPGKLVFLRASGLECLTAYRTQDGLERMGLRVLRITPNRYTQQSSIDNTGFSFRLLDHESFLYPCRVWFCEPCSGAGSHWSAPMRGKRTQLKEFLKSLDTSLVDFIPELHAPLLGRWIPYTYWHIWQVKCVNNSDAIPAYCGDDHDCTCTSDSFLNAVSCCSALDCPFEELQGLYQVYSRMDK